MIAKVVNKENCCGCNACYSICPVQSIDMKPDKYGFLCPSIDADKCILCGECHSVCPMNKKSDYSACKKEIYAGLCIDENVRSVSSSGGLFFFLAEQVIKVGGAVFGATLDNNCEVKHVLVENREELKKLQGSKYVQSNLNDCFKNVKEELKKGRWVLFSGTPCQISGLKNFQGDCEKLILVDFICHGVFSPRLWKKYVFEIERKYQSPVINVEFRNKKNGWRNYSMSINFENGKEVLVGKSDSEFYKIYNSSFGLRDSCYDCKFKGLDRAADITLGDFWGIENLMPELDSWHGCSCIIVHSKRGAKLLQSISDKLVLKNAQLDTIRFYNSSLENSVSQPIKSDCFWQDVDKNLTFKVLSRKYDDTKWVIKVKRRILKILNKK